MSKIWLDVDKGQRIDSAAADALKAGCSRFLFNDAIYDVSCEWRTADPQVVKNLAAALRPLVGQVRIVELQQS